MIQKNVKIFWTENVKIRKQIYAFKGYVSSHKVESLNYFNPELQLKDTEPSIKSKLIDLLAQLKSFQFVITFVLVLKKIESEDKTKYDTFYSNAKEEIVINESDINDVFQSIDITVI